MKLDWLMFFILVGMCLLLGWVMMTPESSVGHGFDHPQFDHMQQGGDGAARHEGMLWAGWLFGVLQIMLFVVCLAMGSRKPKRNRSWDALLIVGGVIYIATFSLLVFTYHESLVEAKVVFLGPFPLPTTVMLYGLWPMPVYFLVVYFCLFDRWVLTADDMDTYSRLLEARQQRAEESN